MAKRKPLIRSSTTGRFEEINTSSDQLDLFGTYTVATLPTLTAGDTGAMLWVSDYSGNPRLMRWGGAVWSPADVISGGGGSLNTASGVVDFGVKSVLASVTISATWVTGSTIFIPTIIGFAPDHDPNDEDVLLEELQAQIVNPVVGVGFTVNVYAPNTTWGRYNVQVVGV